METAEYHQAESEEQPQRESPAQAQSATDKLSFIGNFIDKYYLKQKPWIQSSTFLVFVVLFAYGFINLLSGTRVLNGNAWEQQKRSQCAQGDECLLFAKFYEIRWGTREFVTNSKGEYSVTLGFGEYLRLLGTGKHEITFIKDGKVIATEILQLKRLEGEFADVKLPPSPSPTTEPAPDTGPGAGDSFQLLQQVWAAEPPAKYRLLIERIQLTGGPSKADGDLRLELGKSVMELKDRSHQDLPAGTIPLVSDRNIGLGSTFYFPVPVGSLPVRGRITLTASPGGVVQQIFSKYEEAFLLPDNQTPGEIMYLRGSRGGTLAVRLLFAAEVKLFKKSDLSANDKLESDFLNHGFLVRWQDSPQGYDRETNALWTGPAVSFDIVAKLLQMALDENLALKKVEYKYAFQTTNNPTEMQFGYSGACARSQRIPDVVLKNATAATTEQEFSAAIAPALTCAPPSRRRVARKVR
jgi:hypothetical protein